MGRSFFGTAAACAVSLLVLSPDAALAQNEPAPSFDTWRADFVQRMIDRGLDRGFVHRTLAPLTPDQRVLAREQRAGRRGAQPPPFWPYLDGAVTADRIQRGRQRYAQHSQTLREIEARYGVPSSVLIAIWGMETDYGEATLSYDAVRSIATLASLPRRRQYFETELEALLVLMHSGHFGSQRPLSSWDGGLGQPQFMPTSYARYAVDWNNDGMRDVWTNPEEILGSIANYLVEHGWTRGAPIMAEIERPVGIDTSIPVTNEIREWGSFQVREVLSARRLDDPPPSTTVAVFSPGGADGPTFALYPNFDVVRRYNGTYRFGLAVFCLAAAVSGDASLSAIAPRGGWLSRDQVQELQLGLNELGFGPLVPDGVPGAETWRTVLRFAEAHAMPAPRVLDISVLTAVREADRPNIN